MSSQSSFLPSLCRPSRHDGDARVLAFEGHGLGGEHLAYGAMGRQRRFGPQVEGLGGLQHVGLDAEIDDVGQLDRSRQAVGPELGTGQAHEGGLAGVAMLVAEEQPEQAEQQADDADPRLALGEPHAGHDEGHDAQQRTQHHVLAGIGELGGRGYVGDHPLQVGDDLGGLRLVQLFVFGTEGFGEVGDEVPGFLVAHGNILGVGSEEEALGGISPSWRSRAWARAMSR